MGVVVDPEVVAVKEVLAAETEGVKRLEVEEVLIAVSLSVVEVVLSCIVSVDEDVVVDVGTEDVVSVVVVVVVVVVAVLEAWFREPPEDTVLTAPPSSLTRK